MTWRDEYAGRLASAEEAVSIVESGDRVVIPLTEQPMALVAALIARGPELSDVTISISTPGFDVGALLDAGFHVEVENFIGPNARAYENEGIAPYLPLGFSLTFKTNDERPDIAKPIDVALVTVTPPHENGMLGFGPQPWFKRAYARRANRVIAEVNPSLIRTFGDCFLPVDAFDRLVEMNPPKATRESLMESVSGFEDEKRRELEQIIQQVDPVRLAPMAPRFGLLDIRRLKTLLGLDDPPPAAVAIAENVKKLIRHGSTIQIGVGTPATYLPKLGVFDDKLDLGLHTELTVPGIGHLVDAGVINGSRKTIHKNKAVAVAWSGSDDRDFAVIDGNPKFELYEPDYLLDPWLIAQNHQQVGMNNALSVDLIGQINSESVFGGQMYNGIGGQPETHMGALYSRGGRAITLLYSTAADGAISRIVPRLAEGEIVTIPRFWADTIVTEYGIAELAGRNHRERAEALIAIAHPDFRAELRADAAKWIPG
ncbi:MAG: acetyl-CoA hydrolase/transferase C-terminal domain-containing protein [SAR202 cluster bacterium]|jgi:4-hydroxybutyrate CoA-transferase|nr:acetyl-CoA hydrolase/transferase C-terminal domain-containing protein [SAR202 cluster bacterium]MDP6514106.1 acetyl-CoA hydrolase/transferase C-terminal domain-containing protein [SAR202 cluster bacterium]MDP6714047.1 acetyl-CoA hydrolase/transferase C-terminal domain-containing protein [SAR202 cluster bacterium]